MSSKPEPNQTGPLAGLRCLVCGTDNGKPAESVITELGGKIMLLTRSLTPLPDVVVSDHAGATRLQVSCAHWPATVPVSLGTPVRS